MSADILNELKQQVENLSPQEMNLLADYLLERSKQSEIESAEVNIEDVAEIKRAKCNAWMGANREQYGGLYVALDGDRLLGTGKNYAEAYQASRRAGVKDAYVDYASKPDEMGYMGGW